MYKIDFGSLISCFWSSLMAGIHSIFEHHRQRLRFFGQLLICFYEAQFDSNEHELLFDLIPIIHVPS